jgi:hypothetical protein
MAKTIRIFASSPGDVADERAQLAEVVQELNSTLQALVPEAGIDLELIRWETHSHPDLTGEPQSVIEQQLDGDYDVFVGVMWARFGTPTSQAGSGTEQEFRNAHAGWQRYGRPSHILFYFCEEPIPASVAIAGADQLKSIQAFKDELQQRGLIGQYASHSAFGEKVRRDLVLVLSRILHAAERPVRVVGRPADRVSPSDLAVIRDRVATVAQDYELVRDRMESGPERTRRMEVIASQMRSFAQDSLVLLPELTKSESPGERLAAITALQVAPDPDYLVWLADRPASEKPFVGYHAAVALLAAARDLGPAERQLVEGALSRAESATSELLPDTDRSRTLRLAREELDAQREVRADPNHGRSSLAAPGAGHAARGG